VRRERPSRFRPHLHYELLVCGVVGHALVGLDARDLRSADPAIAREVEGVRWHRCVRCDSWLPVPVSERPSREGPPRRDEIELPLRGRPLRDKIVLRLIAIDRALHFVVLGLLGAIVLVFSASRDQLRAKFYRVMADLQGGTVSGDTHARHGLLHEVDHLFSLNSSKLHLFGGVILVYAAVEGIEAVGLWYQRRWAEYLTFVVTTSLLPLEVYEIATKLSPFKLVAFLVNLAVVVYLLLAKRLFGVRGGVAAEHAIRAADVGWSALDRTTPEAIAAEPARSPS
jgi:uncharacterized membrane protein (DUF2068 family)